VDVELNLRFPGHIVLILEKNMKLRPIHDQCVAITGGASGIGRATALTLAQKGARVAVFDNDEAGLQSLAAEIRSRGGTIVTVRGDVAEEAHVREFADRAAQQLGRIDTWVNAAAVLIFATFEQTTTQEFRRIIDVNLMGQVYGAKAALPYLRRNGGALIMISSVEARRSFPYHSAYAASKHAVDGFVEALRMELKHDGVPVSVSEIMPSTINTPLFEKSMSKIGVKGMGMPPAYNPNTVVNAILYAAENPVRDIVVGGAGKALVATQRISPRLADSLLGRTAFSMQRTDEARHANSPNNLYGPVGRCNGVEGSLDGVSFSHSAATWLDTHPWLKAAATVGAGLGVGAWLAGKKDLARPNRSGAPQQR
jgi:NAD(P)-dependent dehydrogenase (short-subunit alcohol dehydrogenase family)